MCAKQGPYLEGLDPEASTLYKAHITTYEPPSRYLVTSNTTLIPARDCLSMPLNMEPSFANSNVAAVEGA
jgi:hypothetical protein